MRICLVIANYYPKISRDLIKGASILLRKNGVKNIKEIFVPGVLEIPFVVARNIKKYDAFVVLGCVIKGKTPHFNFISEATFNALMQLSITYKKPIGNGIITCLNKKQAIERSNLRKKNKGKEAANAILSVLGILKNVSR